MANMLEVNSYLLSPNRQLTNQRSLARQSKGFCYGIKYHACRGISNSSLCSTSNGLNSCNALQLQGDQARFVMNSSQMDVVDANNLIRGYVEDGLFENAVKVNLNMLESSDPVEEFRFLPSLIKAFGGLSDIKKGRQIHGHVLKLGIFNDTYIENSLLSMYFKLGVTEDAVQLFDKIGKKDTVSWNIMISAFCDMGDYEGSLVLLRHMIEDYGEYPNRVACLSALASAASIQSLIHGQEVHGFVIKRGLAIDEYLVSGLIEMYMKCWNVKYAEHVYKSSLLNEITGKNIVIRNVMIFGYVFNECLFQGLEIFLDVLEIGLRPDHSTMVAVLVLCSHLSNLATGKQIHGFILSNGLQNDVRVETAILDMYFRCGDPQTGLQVFDRAKHKNFVMWDAVIKGSAQCGYATEALNLFSDFTLNYGYGDYNLVLSVIRLCSSITSMSNGKELHGLAVKTGIDSDVFVGGALVDMYAKCGEVKSSQKVFHSIKSRDLVSWNSLISGYAQNDYADEAVKAFRDMQSEGVVPNNVTIACVLSVCAHVSVRMLCKEIYCYVLRRGLDSDILICNSLIAVFSKCGDINGAWVLFQKMPKRNEVSWNSIILGLGLHGCIDEMSAVYEEMKDAGMKPDHATFTALLSACSHTGRVDMGWQYFQSMDKDYKLEPHIEQYTCIVDLLGRAGQLQQAYDLIMAMHCAPDDRIWGSLLGSCKIHGNEKLAELVANHIFKLDPMSIGYRVLLANLYEDFGKWNEVTRLRSQAKEMRLKKEPGCSWIEVNSSVHIFVAGDRSHHSSDEIYTTVKNLTMEMRREGYIYIIHKHFQVISGIEDGN